MNASPDFDVIVLGSGAAGLSAAIEAHDRGANVVVIEREPQTGGSTRLSGGYVTLCDTDMQPATASELLEDLRDAHHGDAHDELSEVYVAEAPETYRFLGRLGFRFGGLEQFAHMRYPWAHEPPTDTGVGGGAQILAALERGARERGIEIRLGAPARRLQTDAAGRVTGVVMEGATNQVLTARQGVIVATGGFTRNPELIKTFGPRGSERIVPFSGPGSLGQGLRMCMDLGAGLAYMGIGVAPTAPADRESGEGLVVIYAGGVLLNQEGKRFFDESAVYVDISTAGLLQTEGLMIQVFDEAIDAVYKTTMMGQRMTGGTFYSADTLAELFEKLHEVCGIDAVAAEQSILDYNANVEAGVDDPEFGRAHLIGSGGDLVPINTPPFHAAVTVPGTSHFNGGLRVTADMRVCDGFGEVIEGLWAAGEIVGGFHGAGYMSGTSMGMALIFGRVAGKSIAV